MPDAVLPGGPAVGVPLRDWLGGREPPWPAAAELEDGTPIVACYSVVRAAAATTRQDKPYLRLELTDLHGTVQARVWDHAERYGSVAAPGVYIGVRGRVEVFQGQPQVNVEHLEQIHVEPDDLGLFMPRCPRDPVGMEAELADLMASVKDPPLRKLLRALIGPKTETGAWYRKAPAAKRNHHAYVGGLLEHTLSVTKLCSAMAEHYGPIVDRDLLIAGALLHDIGKIREIAAQAGFPYTTAGKLLGHILLGIEMVHEAGRKLNIPEDRLRLVEHLIASHQGRYEWQSPREPHTLEALILHYADDTDAKVQQALDLVRSSEAGWTDYSRAFGREFFRHEGAAEPDDDPPADPTGQPDPDTLSLFD
ncbi:MAG: 3'-5' exoribonuclease YhaM family protein [Gemmatimonadota bacterium]